MKISHQTHFPYPVLSSFSDDYLKGGYSVAIEISESLKTGALLLRYEVNLNEESILKAIHSGSAQAGVFITCLETYYNKFLPVNIKPGSVEVEKGMLSGNVSILPLIVATSDIEISSDNFHGDYETSNFDFEYSSVLAVGEEYIVNVGREKLAPVESIFNLAVSDKVPPGEFRVDPDQEKITILAERETYKEIFNIRNTALGKSIMLNSVYLPALMEVLSVLEQNITVYQDKNWFRAFEAKCTHLDINMEKSELLEASQKLLKTPLPRIVKLLREMD